MASNVSNATITLLIIDECAGAAARTGAALAERLPGIRIVTKATRADAPPDDPDLIVWNLADDSPERIGALGLFLQTGPGAPTVVVVPACAPGLVSVAIQAGAEDAVVRTAGHIEQLAAVVMKHAVLIGVPDRDDAPAPERLPLARRVPRGRPPRGPGGVPSEDWRRVRDAVADLQRENRSLREKVSHLRSAANTDCLTGLGNARHLSARLDELFAASQRYGADLACLVLDLDGLKAINDALGHSAGDELLRATADVIRGCIRRSDVAARAGGDEFTILLPHTHVDMAALLAGRLQHALTERTAPLAARLAGSRTTLRLADARPDDTRGVAPLGVSIGIASVAASHAETGRDLVAAADRAMYDAKRRGRGQVAPWHGGERTAA